MGRVLLERRVTLVHEDLYDQVLLEITVKAGEYAIEVQLGGMKINIRTS